MTVTPQQLLHRARALGLRLEPRGDKLGVAPADRCPDDFKAVLCEHKEQLLAWLVSPPCPGWQSVPPADLPLVPYEPRPTPAGRERVICFMLRQTGDRPGALAAWLVRRECAYYGGPGHKWDCASFSYRTAVDCACWQMSCDEKELLSRLETFDELTNRNPTP